MFYDVSLVLFVCGLCTSLFLYSMFYFYFYSFIIFLNFFSSLCNVSLVLSYYDDFIRYIAITNWNECTYIVSRKNTLFLFNFEIVPVSFSFFISDVQHFIVDFVSLH